MLPVLLVLLLGLFDVGRAFIFGVSARQAAREGARLAVHGGLDRINVTNRVIIARAVDAAAPAMLGCPTPTDANTSGGTYTCSADGYGGNWTITVTPSFAVGDAVETRSAYSDQTVQVTVRGSVPLFLSGATAWLGWGAWNVDGTASMRVF